MSIEQVAIDDLRPDPANPRRISDAELEALTRSLREFGFVQPVLARREDNTVIGGHQRLLAARRLGYKTVPVIFLDLTLEQARAPQPRAEQDQRRLGRGAARPPARRPQARRRTSTSRSPASPRTSWRSCSSRWTRARSASASSRSTSTPRWRPHVRHHAPNVASSGRWATTASCAATRPTPATWRGSSTGSKAAMAFTDPPYNVALGDHGGQQRGQRRRRIQNDALPPERVGGLRAARWARNLLATVDGALYVCMSTKEWPLVSRVLEEEGGHWSRHDHLGEGPLRPRPGRLPAPVRADLVRLARGRQAPLVRRPRPGRRLADRAAVGLRRSTRR